MSFEPLPPHLEQSVQRFASQQHITHDEAVIRLIETGLTTAGADDGNLSASPRQSKKGSRAPRSTENPEAIIGLFADLPGFRESIDAVIARRAQRYGFSE